MRKLIKIVASMMVLILMFSLSACGKNEGNIETKSLYTQGLEIVQLMSEMARSEECLDLFYTGNDKVKSVIQDISAGDYTTPKAVYAISTTEIESLSTFELNNLDNVSEGLKSYITQKALGSLMTQINSYGGVEILAATSICTVGKTFVNEDTNEDVIYLYTFDNAVPVAVTFIVGENNAISASGVFIMNERFNYGSADEIKSFFSDIIKVEVTEVITEE